MDANGLAHGLRAPEMDRGNAGKACEDAAAAYFNASLPEEFPESYDIEGLEEMSSRG